MKYRISVKEVSHGCIEVEASTEAEAYEKAETEYMPQRHRLVKRK